MVTSPESQILGAAIMEFASVRLVAVEGWEADGTQVYCRDGWVRVDAPALLHKDRPAEVEFYSGGKIQSYGGPLAQPIWSWSYQREAEHFIAQVRSGQPFRSSGEDTLADVILFEVIYRVSLDQSLTQRRRMEPRPGGRRPRHPRQWRKGGRPRPGQ